MNTMTASINPIADLVKVTYPGQDPVRRQYREGYEHYMNIMPVLEDNDPDLPHKIDYARNIVQSLASSLKQHIWITANQPREFDRTIIAIEPRTIDKEGAELVVARWGKGFSSPVHGHASGYLHEEILYGKMLVNTYKLTPNSNIVRPWATEIVGEGTFASVYNKTDTSHQFKRQALIHNFRALTPAASLHFLPEHTRDGRDNTFVVSRFEEWYDLRGHLQRITSQEAMYSAPGTVILVRSNNVPEYGDHYIYITGAPVQKEHGIRPQDQPIEAPLTKRILDEYHPEQGLILLKLDKETTNHFVKFHGL